jgi:thiamine kinase-like enzyme
VIDLVDDEAAWINPDLAPLSALRPRLREVWSAREDLLAIVETAPQTVVHLDFWPMNLIAADDGTTVAVDWSQVGIGAVAQDIDQLVLDPVWMRVIPDAATDDLESHVVSGYVSGLRTSGFDVNPDEVRRWYAAAAGIHYAPMLGLIAQSAGEPATVALQEARWGVPLAEIVAGRARVVEHALRLGEQVLR